jgi:hypothetical protein
MALRRQPVVFVKPAEPLFLADTQRLALPPPDVLDKRPRNSSDRLLRIRFTVSDGGHAVCDTTRCLFRGLNRRYDGIACP